MKKTILNYYYRLPKSVIHPINCKRRRKYWLSQGVMFIHVPKAAGTSISHALYGRSLGHLKASEIKRWCPKEFKTLFKFGFTRNPWDRAVSAYRFALKGSTETAGIRNFKQYQSPEFRDFDTFVNEWLAIKDLTKVDYVFQPQYLFVLDSNERNLLDFIGKIERIDEDIKKLSVLLNRKIEIPVLNRVTTPGSYKKYYRDRQLINKVGDIYSKDVNYFNYDF